MKKFINGRIILPDGILQKGYLKMDKGKILSLGKMEKNPPDEAGETIIDLKGKYLSPGFIETHCHGGGGFDFMDGSKEAILGAARSHLRYGFTSIMPTTLTSSDEALFETMDAYKEAVGVTENMPHLLGLHLEDPILIPSKRAPSRKSISFIPSPAITKKSWSMGKAISSAGLWRRSCPERWRWRTFSFPGESLSPPPIPLPPTRKCWRQRSTESPI